MRKIKKGDDVIVITGRDKGKRGTVLRVVDDRARDRRRHQRGEEARQAEPDEERSTGGIVDKEMPIHISNVAIFNPATQQGRPRRHPRARRRPQGPLLQVATASSLSS